LLTQTDGGGAVSFSSACNAQSTADGILVVDNQEEIASFNRKFIEMWHIPEPIIASQDEKQSAGVCPDQLKDPESFLKVKSYTVNRMRKATMSSNLKMGNFSSVIPSLRK